MKHSSITIVLLADRSTARRPRALKGSGYRVVTTFTPDHAVAMCVNNPVDAVILDREHFIQTEGWFVAQSLKMIRRNLCVLLVVRGKIIASNLPPASTPWSRIITRGL
jgi:PleD family two-component response regulator